MKNQSSSRAGGSEDENLDDEYELKEEEDDPLSTRSSSKHLKSRIKMFFRPPVPPDLLTFRHPSDRSFVIHPDNWWYALWTQIILIWAVYSSFFTPLEFGFFYGLPERLFILDIAGQFAFLIDIVVRFFVAYKDHHTHRIVSSHSLIARRYLRSRFVVDFLGCMPWDAIYKASGKKELVRYFLWIRLSRGLRVTEFFEKLEKDIRINYLFTRIVKLFVVELYCTHTAACFFYYLATTVPPPDEGYTWIGSLTMGDYSYTNFRAIDLWKRYITALYFAVVTMATVGYGEIHAVNVREMIFVMIYVSFDMILGAYLLGNMAALIVKGSKTERFRDKMADLTKYINKNKLGKKIRNEIKDHLRLQYERGYTESMALQDVPISVREKISEKLYEPLVKEVPLFKGCSLGFIKEIATKIHEEFHLPGQVVIEKGQMVNQVYFVCHGLLKEVGNGEDDENEVPLLSFQSCSSFGEIPILCNVPAPRSVLVCDLSKLLRLDKQSFMDILEIYFSDGRIMINNLLEGKDSNIRKKLLESDIAIHVQKHESELAMRLNCAAYDGDLYRLKNLIRAGADPNRTDYVGRLPLHVASSKGYEDIAQFLIHEGVEINVTDNFGNSPLLEAIRNGHDQVTSLLVKAGASLVIEDAGNCLCMAVVRRDSHFLKRVLAYGINPNSKNYDMRTPLHVAASEGLCSISCLLLEAGASIAAKDRWGSTPLDDARVSGDKKMIKLLEDAKRAQLSAFPDCSNEFQDRRRRKKCTVFPFHPGGAQRDGKQYGVLLWVPPHRIEELVECSKQQLNFASTSPCCIITETGGKILDVDMIYDGQELFLVTQFLP
ncbi:potassium channel SKOR-like [Impatiens glandulifera]|uniref:potassium channel SKOR-like n=1 Tax=Impatiens glandulifera TaxID=253017 RepID=UPI001FB0719D|nr:potassium channel SKOR-like [Impatiens glandulifera]